MTVKRVFALLFSVLILAGIAVGGYWVLERTRPNVCPICTRSIHAKAAVVLELDGKQQRVCCASCATKLGRQVGRPVKLIEVTDYLTERPLRPEQAYFVEGSRIIFCKPHEPPRGPDKQLSDRVFDRCEPSVFSFARRKDAEAFTRANGGVLLRLDQLLGEEARQP